MKNDFEWMNGKEFIYDGAKVCIKRVEKDGREYRVITSDNKATYLSADELREDFVPVVPKTEMSLALRKNIENTNTGLNKLSEKLFSMMDKVESDPAAIKQVEAMNKTAKNIIDVAKVQLAAINSVMKK